MNRDDIHEQNQTELLNELTNIIEKHSEKLSPESVLVSLQFIVATLAEACCSSREEAVDLVYDLVDQSFEEIADSDDDLEDIVIDSNEDTSS